MYTQLSFIEIISMWRPGVQADAHELLIGILNSGAVASSVNNDLIQFDMVTTGSYTMHIIFGISFGFFQRS